MLNAEKHISIPGSVATNDDLDYSFLRKKGIEYIEKLGSKIWTDYNTHDPGITILEMLCYAITDLGLRINLPIEDLLTGEPNSATIEDQFIKSELALPVKPVTALDYRKLFIDIDGVKNAWLLPFRKKIFANRTDNLLSYNSFEDANIKKEEFTLQGLYEILLDFDEFDSKESTAKIAERKQKMLMR